MVGRDPNQPLRRYEFDLWRKGYEKRVAQLEDWRRDHERGHEQDEQDDAAEDRENRRWSWQQVTAAAISAAAVVAAAAITALGK